MNKENLKNGVEFEKEQKDNLSDHDLSSNEEDEYGDSINLNIDNNGQQDLGTQVSNAREEYDNDYTVVRAVDSQNHLISNSGRGSDRLSNSRNQADRISPNKKSEKSGFAFGSKIQSRP